jgi:phosphoglucomutase
LAGSEISVVKDYETLIERNLITGEELPINQKISANVLQFFTLDGSKVSVRPSGTEPKIKFYIEVKDKMDSPDQYDETENRTNQKIDQVMVDLGL